MTSLWRNAQYVSWLISDTSKGLASTLFGFAIPLIALIVTNDPAQAGIIGGVGAAVRVSLTMFGGVLADRHRRITLMVIGASVGVVLSIAFTALALGNALTFATLLVIDVLLAARTGLFDPAGEAILKDLVAPDTMGRAQAANQARDAALQLAGGPIGGALLIAGGWLVGAVMALCHLVSAVAAMLIPRLRGADAVGTADAGEPGSTASGVDAPGADTAAVTPDVASLTPEPAAAARRVDARHAVAGSQAPDDGTTNMPAAPEVPRSEASDSEASGTAAAAAPSRNAMREIREGFSWLFARRDLRGVLVISTVINLGVNTVFTTIIYAMQQDGISTAVIGLISAGMGATMLVGALVAGPLVSRIGTGTLMLVGLIAFTVGSSLAVFTRDPWGIVLVMALPGLLLAPLNAGLGGYFMVATPSSMMGRVGSASAVFSMGAMPLAPLLAGFGLSMMGRTGTIILGAALCLIATAMAVMNGPLRSLPTESGWAAHAKQYEVGGELVEAR